MKEVSILKSNSKGVVSNCYLNNSLFPNRDILTKKLNYGRVLEIDCLQNKMGNYLKYAK